MYTKCFAQFLAQSKPEAMVVIVVIRIILVESKNHLS